MTKLFLDSSWSLPGLFLDEASQKLREPPAPFMTTRQKRLLKMADRLTDKQLNEALSYMEWLLEKNRKRGAE